MHNVITIIDHAFTRPWTVDKRYRRIRNVTWYMKTIATRTTITS
jgi:hypothetical protein